MPIHILKPLNSNGNGKMIINGNGKMIINDNGKLTIIIKNGTHIHIIGESPKP